MRGSASDSGLSSPATASPASSLDKHEAKTHIEATPLSSAKPRSRPKSQHIPKQNNDSNVANRYVHCLAKFCNKCLHVQNLTLIKLYCRLSLHTGYDNLVVDHAPQVYTVSAVTQEAAGAGDSVTYADLDPRAFMVPHNKVLPTQQQQQSSSDPRSTYAEISSKPMYV